MIVGVEEKEGEDLRRAAKVRAILIAELVESLAFVA
jgi:hypothetical protein